MCEESGTREAVSGAVAPELGLFERAGTPDRHRIVQGKSACHELVQLLRECAGCSALHDSAWNAPLLNGGRAPDASGLK